MGLVKFVDIGINNIHFDVVVLKKTLTSRVQVAAI